MNRSLAATLAQLPPLPPKDARPALRAATTLHPQHKLVVLDDDPTGTQTVYDVPVLTTWSVEALRAEFAREGACFYILTNSRSLAPAAARALTLELARNLASAAGEKTFTLVSRGDSTLRGHFPLETDALAEVLGPFDVTFLVPYFEAGGRYTLDDIHFVAEGDVLVPAAETPFARDASFGYTQSNLRAWIEEKSAGRIRADDVASLSIDALRGSFEDLVARVVTLPRGAYCVVNAASPRDVERFAFVTLAAEKAGSRYLFRTAAQFVSARLGLALRPLLTPGELHVGGEGGGLIVVGSHVPKTTAQLQVLLERGNGCAVELAVGALLGPGHDREMARVRTEVNAALRRGEDVVVFTSRQLVASDDAEQSLSVSRRVSDALVALVQTLEVRPRYLVAKGGITSSDLATRGLGVQRARVLGQILPGIPVWETGGETRHPGLCYVVFPGNVGGPDALAEVWQKLARGAT